MKLRVRVQPNARKPGVEQLPDGTLKVKVTAPPHDGKANKALVEALAEHFGVPGSRVKILSGERSRSKLIEIT